MPPLIRHRKSETFISYPGPDGHSLHGYLAQPDGPGPHPGVLLIHEWWGLNQDITALADTLAAEGYVVLAPDAYRGRTTNLIPRAIWLVSTTSQPQIGADMDSALAYLRRLDSVDAARVGSVMPSSTAKISISPVRPATPGSKCWLF